MLTLVFLFVLLFVTAFCDVKEPLEQLAKNYKYWVDLEPKEEDRLSQKSRDTISGAAVQSSNTADKTQDAGAKADRAASASKSGAKRRTGSGGRRISSGSQSKATGS